MAGKKIRRLRADLRGMSSHSGDCSFGVLELPRGATTSGQLDAVHRAGSRACYGDLRGCRRDDRERTYLFSCCEKLKEMFMFSSPQNLRGRFLAVALSANVVGRENTFPTVCVGPSDSQPFPSGVRRTGKAREVVSIQISRHGKRVKG